MTAPPADPATQTNSLRFSMTRLRPGQVVQLHISDPVRNTSFASRYIGFVENRSVLLTMPVADGRTIYRH